MTGALNHDTITALLEALSDRLRARGTRGHVYLVGGAAMILGFRRERTTHDVDARIVSDKEGVLQAAGEIAREYGLPDNWLNENATLFMPHASDVRARTVFNTPHLVVTGASAEHLLAMKLDAARDTDEADVRILIRELKIERRDQALEIHRRIFPHKALSEKGKELLASCLPDGPGLRPRGS